MTGDVNVIVYATPEAEIFTANQLCPPAPSSSGIIGPRVELIGDGDNGTWIRWRQLNGPHKLDIQDSTEEAAFVMIPGLDEYAVYGFRLLSKKGTLKVCEGMADIELTIFEEPRLVENGGEVDAGPFTVQYWSDIVYLNATTNSGTGVWTTLTEGVTIDDPSSASTSARNLILYKDPDYISNEFIWTVNNGVCSEVYDTVSIIRYDIKNYDGFSPNDDGINDYLIMQGLNDSQGDYLTRNIFTINIYNAVGNLVRKITQDDEFTLPASMDIPLKPDERIVWDGLSANGSKVQPGIYYYGMEYYTIILNSQQVEINRVTGTPRRGSIVVKGY